MLYSIKYCVQMLYSIKYCVQAGIGWYRLDLPSVGPRGTVCTVALKRKINFLADCAIFYVKFPQSALAVQES